MNDPFDLKRYAAVARQAVAEGIVLLKNDRNALPLREGARIAVFGRSPFHYYKSGTGSGGSVNTGEITAFSTGYCECCAQPTFYFGGRDWDVNWDCLLAERWDDMYDDDDWFDDMFGWDD